MTRAHETLDLETQRVILGAYARRAAPRPLPGGVDADDLVQEAWLRLTLRYGAELATREPGVFCALARRAVSNLTTDLLRRRRFEATESSDSLPCRRSMDELTTRLDLSRLVSALRTLSEPEQRFLLAAEELQSIPAAQSEAAWPPRSPYYHHRRLVELLRGQLCSAAD